MLLWTKLAKVIFATAACLFIACTFSVEVPPIRVVTGPEIVETHDIKEAYKSVAMVGLQSPGSTKVLGIGTAFAIDEKNLISAGHVCTGIRELQNNGVVTGNIFLTYLGRSDRLASRRGAKIKNIDSVNDLCHIEMPMHGLTPLKFASVDSIKLGDKVFIVGAPNGVMISITEGQVMNTKTSGLQPNIINGRLAITAASTGGHSGSPILNTSGEVVGVLVMGHSTYDHLNFGVRVPIIERFMKIVGIRSP